MLLAIINSLSTEKNLDCSKIKAFADDIINMTEKLKFVLGRFENVVGKKEKMLVASIFSISHNVFKRLLIQCR